MYRLAVMFLVLMWAVPHLSEAAVIINEIAWMGSSESANDEWIELLNTSSNQVSVDGWTLTDGLGLEISLSGQVGPDEYVVLERTNDDSAPGSAFMIYTGALSNSGVTLTLRRADGSIVDQVAGGENWDNIGGDNSTKETAQYTVSGWVTAKATPGDVNSTETKIAKEAGSAPKKSTNLVTKQLQSSGQSTVEVRSLTIPDNKLSLEIVTPVTIYENQTVSFRAEPKGLGEIIMDSLQYTWNFGDLTTSTGQSTKHLFTNPGEYLVTVRAKYAHYDEVFQKQVTVLPVRFSLATDQNNNLLIHNESRYEVDVSGFRLIGNEVVTFPELSFIPAGGTLTIPTKRFSGLKLGQATLEDRHGSMLANLNPAQTKEELPKVIAQNPIRTETITAPPPTTVTGEDFKNNFSFSTTVSANETATTVSGVDQSPVLAASAIESQGTTESSRENWPLFGLLGVITLGLFSLAISGPKTQV